MGILTRPRHPYWWRGTRLVKPCSATFRQQADHGVLDVVEHPMDETGEPLAVTGRQSASASRGGAS